MNRQIWELKNQILELSTKIQEEEEVKVRLIEEYQEGGFVDYEEGDGGNYDNDQNEENEANEENEEV